MRAGSALLSPEILLQLGLIQPGAHVIEIGPSRTGHFLFPAARHVGEDGRVTAIDIHKDTLRMLEGLRRQYLVHNLHLLWADAEEQLPLTEQSVDAAYLINTLGLFRKPQQLFTDIRRVLKPKGKVIVVDWHPERSHPLAPRWDFRINPEKLDIFLAYQAFRATHKGLASDHHWARVYEGF